MKWPWPRHVRDRIVEAEQAAQDAQADLEATKAQRPMVERETAQLRRHREQNHLTELFQELINPGRG